jgi:polyketide biosynthesis enoyl-CoA hydratase PksH
MEIRGAAVVRLPEHLSTATVDVLLMDLYAAFDSPAGVVVFVGADAGTFCSGMAMDSGGEGVEARSFASVLVTLLDAPKPTLAFVDGRALGSGLGLAAACDWVTSTDRAVFGLPELLWGLIPATIWPIVTSRMGEGAARRWTISAHARSAKEALAAGLVDEVVPGDASIEGVNRAVGMLHRAEPDALRALRHWMFDARDESVETTLARGASVTARLAADPATRARVLTPGGDGTS